MNEELNLQNFNDVRAIYNVLGNICNNTELLREDDIQLKKEDFMQRLHKIIFSAVHNITFNTSGDSVTTVSAKDIDNYLSAYPTQYKLWNDQKGFEYVGQITEHCNEETFRQSYDRVKKMAVLREYQQMGFDVSDLYEWDSDDYLAREKSLKAIDKMKMQDIFEHFTLKNLKIKDDFNIETDIKRFKIGNNIKELLDKSKEGRQFGYATSCGFENSAFGGLGKGKFLLRSGSTGSLKTSLQIRDMIDVAVDKIYKDGKWVYHGVSIPSLFISTELDEEDLNYLALSYLTGINRKIIKDGYFDKKQRELLEEAGEILKESPLYMVHMPSFTINDLQDTIERHIIEKGVQYVAFDYISNNSRLQRSINELYGSVQREDQVLLYLSTSLKTIAEKYDISIQSATQLNRNGIGKDTEMNSNALRGSSSISDKVDYGLILKRPLESDLEKVKNIIEQNGFGNEPTLQRFLYKNRNGMPEIVMYTRINPATIREECLFVTDYDGNIVEDIEDLQFEYQEGKTERDIEYEKKYSGEGNRTFGEVVQKVDYDLDF